MPNAKISTKLLLETLKSVPGNFDKNELAYLSLTAKIEHPFRDKWAFILYKKLPSRKFIVSREWKRRDLVILNNPSESEPEPEVLIELTAMYTFDALSKKNRDAYIQKLKNDETKAKKAKKEVYLVLLMVHPRKQIEKYEGIVKYRNRINKALKEYENSVKKKAIKEIKSCFEKAKFTACRYSEHGIGKAFGVDVELLYWLIKSK